MLRARKTTIARDTNTPQHAPNTTAIAIANPGAFASDGLVALATPTAKRQANISKINSSGSQLPGT